MKYKVNLATSPSSVPTLVSCVIIQLFDIKVTNNLANTNINGLKLLVASLISEG